MALGLCLATASQASAKEVYHGFVKDPFYLGRGGTPAALAEVANNPLSIFRSRLAYDTLRSHFGEYLGRPLSDEDFRALLLSDRVRLVPCYGMVDTSGVTDSGRFGWHLRACYRGEMLIELTLDDGRRVIVASQACYNAVRGRVPTKVVVTYQMPPPPPVEKKIRCRVVTSRQVTVVPQYRNYGGVVIQGCCFNCGPGYVNGILQEQAPIEQSSSTFHTECE